MAFVDVGRRSGSPPVRRQAGKSVLSVQLAGSDVTMWIRKYRRSPSGFRVLLYDSRANGQSRCRPAVPDRGPGPRPGRLLDALGLERVRFCGLSRGGMVGMWLATNAPEGRAASRCAIPRRIRPAEPAPRIEARPRVGPWAVCPVLSTVLTSDFAPARRRSSRRSGACWLATPRKVRGLLRGHPRHGPARLDRRHPDPHPVVG